MDTFFWVLDWEGMISASSLVGLLDRHFFAKWLQVRGWLRASREGCVRRLPPPPPVNLLPPESMALAHLGQVCLAAAR